MKKYLLLSLTFLMVMFISGCGESIYSGVADTTTSEANTDQMDFDFINGKCQPVISYYDSKILNEETLNDDDIYKYVSAILTCSGFDIVKGIDSILITGGSDIYKTSGDLMGISVIDMNTSKFLQEYYDKAISVCYDRKVELEKDELSLNTTNLTICGLAGMMGTVVNMSAMMLNTSGGGANKLELSQTGFEEFAQKEMDPSLAGQFLGSYLKEKSDFLGYLNNSLTIEEDGADDIGSLIGQSNFSSVLSDLAGELRDSNGNITEPSLLNYLKTSLGLNIITPPVPPIP